jgi:hypothetical protein
VIPAPVRAPAEPEEEPSWSNLVEGESPTAQGKTATPRAARRGPTSFTQRIGGLPMTAASRRLGWVIGIASLFVFTLILVVGILTWVFTRNPDSTKQDNTGVSVIYVSSQGGNNASPTIADALSKIRGKSRQAARIVVQDDVTESDVLIDVPKVSIEAEAGKAIRWRPSAKAGAARLFSVHKAEGVHVKGITLDGENRVDILVNLYHRCPGTRFEDMKLMGFRKYGFWVTNAEGGKEPDRRIQFNRLEIVTSQPEQAAFFFSIARNVRDTPPKNQYFSLSDCKFEGPGAKVKTPDPATLDHIDLPAGVQIVQGN